MRLNRKSSAHRKSVVFNYGTSRGRLDRGSARLRDATLKGCLVCGNPLGNVDSRVHCPHIPVGMRIIILTRIDSALFLAKEDYPPKWNRDIEVAFRHKPTRTLLVTDAVIFVPRNPPECISKESLLASAKNGLAVNILSKGKDVPEEPVVESPMNCLKGWKRMVLQILFLGPSNLLEPKASFSQMSQKLIVSLIVKTLVFSKVPEKVRDWIDNIARDWIQEDHPSPFRFPGQCRKVRVLSVIWVSGRSFGRAIHTTSIAICSIHVSPRKGGELLPSERRRVTSLQMT